MSDRPVALVTGGAGGIGSAICRRLASDGCAVLVASRSATTRGAALLADLEGDGHRAIDLDVNDPASLAAAAAEIERLDVLVNCAGVTEPVPHDDLAGLTDDLIDTIFATNWRGPFGVIRALEPALRAAPSPVIVNISSVAAVTGQGSNVAYCASKAALDSMTRSLGRALAPHIRVVSVSPGWVAGEYADRLPTGVLEAQRDAAPLRKLATPDDVAAAVRASVFDLPCTTGSIVAVDGGRPLGVS